MYRIEFSIRCESGAESKAIVRLDDIIDVVVKGHDCTKRISADTKSFSRNRESSDYFYLTVTLN